MHRVACFIDRILNRIIVAETVFGKPVGSDAENGKTTVLSFMSLDEAQELAASLTETAKKSLEKYGVKSKDLIELADYLLNRNV